jgi:hypothetical protein
MLTRLNWCISVALCIGAQLIVSTRQEAGTAPQSLARYRVLLAEASTKGNLDRTDDFWRIVRLSQRAVIFITAPDSLGHQTATMADRTLKDTTYSDGIPSSGRCSKCGQLFSAPPDAAANPEKATRDFYAAFRAHECPDQE